jgi:hypothetical protein
MNARANINRMTRRPWMTLRLVLLAALSPCHLVTLSPCHAQLPEPKLVSLPAKRISLSQALAELTKQTGIAIVDARGGSEEMISLDVRQMPFWQALDALADAAKARVNLYPSSGRIVLDKRGPHYRLPPISYDGRFRLCVKKVTTSRDLERRDSDAHSGATNLAVEIAWDPLLLPLYLETRPWALRLVDDKNNALTIPDEGSALAPVDGLIALNVDLRLPKLPRGVNAIRSLQGELSMIGPSKMLDFAFDRLDRLAKANANDPERRLTQEKVTCRILDVQLLAQRWTVRVALDYPPGMKQLDSNQSWVVNNEMILESPDGKKRLTRPEYVVESASPRQAILSYHFRDKPGMPRGKASAWRLRYRAPANLIEVPIKFAFKDIELP